MQDFSFNAVSNAGSWLLLLGVVAWWIRGMADRKRAGTEALTADSKASAAQFYRLEKEIERLNKRVEVLENKSEAQLMTIADLTAMNVKEVAARAAENVVHTAAMAAKDALIKALQSHGSSDPLVDATEHNAKATDRVADAVEQAIGANKG